MQILMHTMACPDRDPEDAVALAADLGLDGVELVCQSGYRCAIAPDAPISTARRIAATADQLGVGVRAITPYAKGLNADDPVQRRVAVEELMRVLDLAAALGASVVRIFAGQTVRDDDLTDALARFGDSAVRLSDRALEMGLQLCIENHMDTMAVSAAKTMAVLDAVGRHPAFGVLYDQANLDFMQAEPFPEGYRIQAEAIRHVHVKDFRWVDGERLAAPVGAGCVAWPDILRALKADSYDGFLCLEYERRWFPDQLPEPERGVAQSRDALLAMIAANDRGRPAP